MPTKKELHFVSASNLEFGMDGDVPLSPSKRIMRNPRGGKTVGRYIKGPDGKLKLKVNRKEEG